VEPLVAPPPGSNGSGENGLVDTSPFIFTPIVQQQSADSLRRKKAFHWVQGEVASVEISVINPLPVELRISNMALLHEGAEFDAFPSSFVLAPEGTGPNHGRESAVSLKLSGIPKEAGVLNILGYSCVIFGVKSNCRLKSLDLGLDEDHILVEVCPSIPRLVMSLLEDHHGRQLKPGETLELNAFHGELESFGLSLLNASTLVVERLSIDFTTVPSKYGKCVSKTDVGEVIKPGDAVDFSVRIQSPITRCDYRREANEMAEEVAAEVLAKAEHFSLNVIIKYSSNPETSRG
jgi:hypothetical protein